MITEPFSRRKNNKTCPTVVTYEWFAKSALSCVDTQPILLPTRVYAVSVALYSANSFSIRGEKKCKKVITFAPTLIDKRWSIRSNGNKTLDLYSVHTYYTTQRFTGMPRPKKSSDDEEWGEETKPSLVVFHFGPARSTKAAKPDAERRMADR